MFADAAWTYRRDMTRFARATFASVLAGLLVATAAVAQELPSDADTPSDSPSAWHSVWPWLLIGIGGFALLLLVALGVSWHARRPAEPEAESPPQAPAPTPERSRP